MSQPTGPRRPPRRYPAVYEKWIPIALAVIVLATAVALAFAVAVALRLLPGIVY
ncbi:MAG: hypothetical protein ACP5UQ_01350 [Anaerolineae bacterium]